MEQSALSNAIQPPISILLSSARYARLHASNATLLATVWAASRPSYCTPAAASAKVNAHHYQVTTLLRRLESAPLAGSHARPASTTRSPVSPASVAICLPLSCLGASLPARPRTTKVELLVWYVIVIAIFVVLQLPPARPAEVVSFSVAATVASRTVLMGTMERNRPANVKLVLLLAAIATVHISARPVSLVSSTPKDACHRVRSLPSTTLL